MVGRCIPYWNGHLGDMLVFRGVMLSVFLNMWNIWKVTHLICCLTFLYSGVWWFLQSRCVLQKEFLSGAGLTTMWKASKKKHIALQKHGSYSYYLHPWTNWGFHIRCKVIYVTYVLWSQTCSWKQRVHFLKFSARVSGHNAVGSHPFVSIMHLLCMDSQIRQLQLVELNASDT